MGTEERIDWLRLQRTPNVGPITFHTLLERFSSAKVALDALPELATRGGGRPPKPPGRDQIAREIRRVEKSGGVIVASCEPAYPALLRTIADPPPSLTVLGHRHLLERPAVALVGARNASLNGRRLAAQWAAALAEAGWLVISGLARGIDTAAHEGALAGGTLAVVAGGVDVVYPAENEGLWRAMREQGAVVGEMALGTSPTARHFPRRNRIISGLARGVVVIEAATRSGSLITARLAGEQGRMVMAVPGSPLDPRTQGTNKLIQEGARLVQSVDDIIDELGQMRPDLAEGGDAERPSAPPVIPAAEAVDRARATILEALSFTPTPVDELIRGCQLSAPVVAAVLVELELAGRIERQPGNRICLLER